MVKAIESTYCCAVVGVTCMSSILGTFEFSDDEFERVMALPKRTWTDFPTYKKQFEALRPLFALLAKAGRVPESFYMKFCFPNQLGETGERVGSQEDRAARLKEKV